MVSYARFSGVTARSPRSWRTLGILGGPEPEDAAPAHGAPLRHNGGNQRATGLLRLIIPALRAMVAVVCAAAVSGVAWGLVGNQLSVTTDMVGSTTFYDFDIYHYIDHFYILAIVLPALAAVLFLVLARWGPLASRDPHPLWPPPLSAPDTASPALGLAREPTSPEAGRSPQLEQQASPRLRLSAVELASVIARLALPALVIAAEIEIASS